MSEPTSQPPESPPPARIAPPGAVWACAIAAGLLAAVAAWAVGEAIEGRFRPVETTAMGPGADEEARKVVAGMAREAALAFAALAGACGLLLGAAGGLARRSARGALAGAATGVVLAVGAEAAAAAILLPIAGAHRAELNEDLLLPLLILGGIWAALGLGAGVGFGVGLGGRDRIVRGAAGGLMGGAVATVLFLLAGAMAFPLAQASSPNPTSAAVRFLARAAVGLGVAAGAAAAVQAGGARPPGATTT